MNSSALRLDLIAGVLPWIFYGIGKWIHSPVLGAISAIGVLLGIRLRTRSPLKLYEFSILLFFFFVAIHRIFFNHPALLRYESAFGPGLFDFLALISVLRGEPYTLQYAREMTPESWWNHPQFIRVNVILTWFWVGTLSLTTLLQISHARSGIPNAWIAQSLSVGLSLLALGFTRQFPLWYRYHIYLPRVRKHLEPHLLRWPPKSAPVAPPDRF